MEEIVAHRQHEVLAMLPYLDGDLRRDLPAFAAEVVADYEERLKEVVRGEGRIILGMHVLAAGDRAKKGVVVSDEGAEYRDWENKHSPYTVRWDDDVATPRSRLEHGLKPADIVLDEAAAEGMKTKPKEVQGQILSEFDALCADLKTQEKISWYTKTPLFDGCVRAVACAVRLLLTPGAHAQAQPGRQLQAGRGRCHRLQAGRAHAPRQGARASPPQRSIHVRASHQHTEADSRRGRPGFLYSIR